MPLVFSLRILDAAGYPRRLVPYLLTVRTAGGEAGKSRTGETDFDGFLHEPIPYDAVGGELILRTSGGLRSLTLRLGYLEPVDTVRGVQSRLNNLGYPCGAEDGVLNEETQEALRHFQRDYGLPATGQEDEATRAKLKDVHRS